MSKRSYKVWVQIEEFVNGQPQSGAPVLPDSVGLFEGRGALKAAMSRVAEIVLVHGIDPEESDSVKATQADRKKIIAAAKALQDARHAAADRKFETANLDGVTVNDTEGWETDGPDRLIRKFYYEDEEHPEGDSRSASFIVVFKPNTAKVTDSHANF
jgi:hypothetical protein